MAEGERWAIALSVAITERYVDFVYFVQILGSRYFSAKAGCKAEIR